MADATSQAAMVVEAVPEPPALFSPFSKRLHIGLLLMFAFFCTVSMRSNLGMAMVCMVNATAYSSQPAISVNLSYSNQQCQGFASQSSASHDGYNGDILWTPGMQSMLFSALFYGGMVTILPSGYFADRFGPKAIMFVAVLDYAVMTLLTPLLARSHFYAFLASRVVMGLGEGIMFPSITSMSARWFPPNERSTMAAIYTSGVQLASISTAIFSSRLCMTSMGWPSVFYLFGGIGLLWLILWWFAACNRPNDSKIMSDAEKIYLNIQLNHQHSGNSSRKLSQAPTPWRSMLLSPPMIANLLCQFSFNFSMTMFQSYLPTYFKDVLYLDLKDNGFYTAIPFIGQVISKNVFSWISDHLKKAGVISSTTGVRVFQAIASFGTAAALIGIATFVDCTTPTLALLLLALFGVSFGGGIPGFTTSLLSVAPAYTGTLVSLGMVFGMLANIAAPTVIGLINTNGTPEQWSIIFFLAAGVNITAGLLFVLVGSGEMQKWADVARMQTVRIEFGEKVFPSRKTAQKRKEHSVNEWRL
uniref:MFS domain-containing protein n=1 Tax=Steinernema glaseri TaxID=37863 RepID=A0A1I7Y1H8_9BILA